MTPAGEIQFAATVKEALLDELKAQTVGIEPVALRIEKIRRQSGLLELSAGDQLFRAQRVIVAIPYTSIVEQTADVLGGIFGRDNLVEHHSQADTAAEHETARSRLACENWDAPLIVTTNVQLFESLFACLLYTSPSPRD